MTPTSPAAPGLEPWLRGTHSDVPAVARAVLHALDLRPRRSHPVDRKASPTPKSTPSPSACRRVAFHLRHMARSTDRILTYAEGTSSPRAVGRSPGRTNSARELWPTRSSPKSKFLSATPPPASAPSLTPTSTPLAPSAASNSPPPSAARSSTSPTTPSATPARSSPPPSCSSAAS